MVVKTKMSKKHLIDWVIVLLVTGAGMGLLALGAFLGYNIIIQPALMLLGGITVLFVGIIVWTLLLKPILIISLALIEKGRKKWIE